MQGQILLKHTQRGGKKHPRGAGRCGKRYSNRIWSPPALTGGNRKLSSAAGCSARATGHSLLCPWARGLPSSARTSSLQSACLVRWQVILQQENTTRQYLCCNASKEPSGRQTEFVSSTCYPRLVSHQSPQVATSASCRLMFSTVFLANI